MSHLQPTSHSPGSSLSQHIAHWDAPCRTGDLAPYLLLDRGDMDLPGLDGTRMAPIPDDYFEDAPALAPQLVRLDWRDARDQALMRDALALALDHAQHRLGSQPVSALLLAPSASGPLLQHLAALGLQYAPAEAGLARTARLFRYQDPRVMQRVWPSLAPAQRNAWLGPAAEWLSALQPTGPLHTVTSPQLPALWAATHAAAARQAAAPDADDAAHASRRPHHLLDGGQWVLAHSAPAENMFWHGFASQARTAALDAGTRASRPPASTALRAWLHEAASHGLSPQDQADWAQARHQADEARWHSADGQSQVRQALALLQAHHGLRFADAWRMAQSP